jgi:hypothetical protein
MFNIIANGNRLAYGIKKYMVKTVADIKTIPINNDIAVGSKVLVTTTGETYILDSDKHWVKYIGASTGAGEEVIYEGGDLTTNDPDDEEVDYDGGSY